MPRSGDTFIGGLVNWFSSDIVRINSLNFLNALMVNNSLIKKTRSVVNFLDSLIVG